METMGQTKKRDKKSDGINPTKKKRKSTGAAIGTRDGIAEGRTRNKKTRVGEQFSADNNAAGDIEDDSATVRRPAEAATKKSQNRQLQFMQSKLNQQHHQSQALLNLVDRLASEENR